MPELPEVETVKRGLNQKTLMQKIVGGEVVLDRTIAHPLSCADFLAGVTGTAIAKWYRKGKYLLAELTQLEGESPRSAGWLGVHLRMTGQLLWLEQDTPLQKHTRLRLFFGDRQELRFVDQRTFGKVWWVSPGVEPASIITGLGHLGPEPFTPEFSLLYLVNKLQRSQRAIKTAILDQSLVAGVGNIYADEALFVSRIRPETNCTKLTTEQISRLRSAIIEVLQAGIDSGGTTFSNFLNIHGVNGNYAGIAWVYNRAGQPCRNCSTPIERLKLAGIFSHFCPKCQH